MSGVHVDVNLEDGLAQVLSAPDLDESISWHDFGTRSERVAAIRYTSAKVIPGKAFVRTFQYTEVTPTRFRLDGSTLSMEDA